MSGTDVVSVGKGGQDGARTLLREEKVIRRARVMLGERERERERERSRDAHQVRQAGSGAWGSGGASSERFASGVELGARRMG
eukprot:2157418-Rhodomonas_salina.3